MEPWNSLTHPRVGTVPDVLVSRSSSYIGTTPIGSRTHACADKTVLSSLDHVVEWYKKYNPHCAISSVITNFFGNEPYLNFYMEWLYMGGYIIPAMMSTPRISCTILMYKSWTSSWWRDGTTIPTHLQIWCRVGESWRSLYMNSCNLNLKKLIAYKFLDIDIVLESAILWLKNFFGIVWAKSLHQPTQPSNLCPHSTVIFTSNFIRFIFDGMGLFLPRFLTIPLIFS